ncbi:MAG TPA: NAD(P)-binding protein, partial [Kribbella sp.]|nr:NAD(P)-binding protein [Kribbella sp.]
MTAVEDASTINEQDARVAAEEWLAAFGPALTAGDVDAAMTLFARDASWRDLLAFSWHFSTYPDPSAIAEGLHAHARDRAPRDFRVTDRVPPQTCQRGGREVVEVYYEFATDVGECEGVLRLVPDGTGGHVAWTLMTALREIRGHEPQVGARRPRTDQGARFGESSWAARRARRDTFEDREPAVLVVGAGQSGLSLAAHLRALGVDALVVEKSARIGDNWRSRYDSLVLHTETPVNHLPYLPFPETFP